jgi:hypothetical protein
MENTTFHSSVRNTTQKIILGELLLKLSPDE